MRKLIITCCALSWLPISEAHAYIGPGVGLGAVGVVLGLVLSVVLALVGLFWYPIKRRMRKPKPPGEPDAAPTATQADAGDDLP